jgi:FecR-like protein
MRGPRANGTPGLLIAMILGVLWQATVVSPATAQQSGASAEIKRVIGRVEILRTGETQWTPAVAGARLVTGDDIRAFSGASAELALPDASVVVLVENSRLQLSKLEFDRQQQSRFVLLHLAVGKLRAAISQAGITLVRARQSNFAISTPTAVAAARGTVVWVFTDGQKSLMAVEPEPGLRIPSRIECITLSPTDRKRQMVLAGGMSADCSPPLPTPLQFQTFSNRATAGANLGAPVVAPSSVNVLALITTPPQSPAPAMNLGSPVVASGVLGPSSLGVNQNVFTPPPPPVCATDPCN